MAPQELVTERDLLQSKKVARVQLRRALQVLQTFLLLAAPPQNVAGEFEETRGHWVTLAARSPIRRGRRHSRAARSRDIVRAPDAFRQHPVAAVPRLAEQPQPEQAGQECDQTPLLRKAFRAPKRAGSKRRKMRDRASPLHPEVQLPSAGLARSSR